MADFSVDTAKLRDLAGSLDGSAYEARSLIRRAHGAQVPPDAWGPLGDHRGLPDLYAEVRAQADATLGRVFDFLANASESLVRTAGDYDEQERETASIFERIERRRFEARRPGDAR